MNSTLTGTPLDLTVIPEFLRWLGVAVPLVWLGLLVGALVWAWRGTQTKLGRSVAVAVVLLALVVLPGWGLNSLRQQVLAQQAKAEVQQAEFLKRRAVAEALFKQRCETAGEFIYKTVPDVKGVVWMKWRMPGGRDAGQFELSDPVGHSCVAMECIEALLRPEKYKPASVRRSDQMGWAGFQFVEARDPVDNKLYRFQLAPGTDLVGSPTSRSVEQTVRKMEIAELTAPFGIRWEDISTQGDRGNWIAGGALSVVNLQTNEVLATRIRYAMDPQLGNVQGFRSPWGFAMRNACPAFPAAPGDASRIVRWATEDYEFATKVLQPSKGE